MNERAGEPWDGTEEAHLRNRVHNGATLQTLCEVHQRTRGGIESRLLKLGFDLGRMRVDFFSGFEPPHAVWYNDEEGRYLMRNEPSGRLKGRFWMIQNDGLSGNKDSYGHARLSWPGASVFETKAEAVEAAREMAQRQPNDKFYVMEAVALIETTKPPVKVTTWKKSA